MALQGGATLWTAQRCAPAQPGPLRAGPAVPEAPGQGSARARCCRRPRRWARPEPGGAAPARHGPGGRSAVAEDGGRCRAQLSSARDRRLPPCQAPAGPGQPPQGPRPPGRGVSVGGKAGGTGRPRKGRGRARAVGEAALPLPNKGRGGAALAGPRGSAGLGRFMAAVAPGPGLRPLTLRSP